MKKSTIWILTILMVLTFAGLLSMQIMYMTNMIKMRDDQFSEGVRRSLYAVTSLLEQDETRYFLEEDVDRIETTAISGASTRLEGIIYSFKTQSGVQGDLTIKADNEKISKLQNESGNIFNNYKSMQEMLKGQYLYQRGLIDEVILNIISQSSNRPIDERADSTTIRTYLHTELANNGLDLPFEFAIVNRNGIIQYHTTGYDNMGDERDNNMFVQTLFPNDPINKRHYLKVFFPDKKDYILSSIKFMIPTFAFTFILLVIFVFVIILAFRQKRLTEMKNDFINNMTHEFKTPISSISLAAQMLKDDSVRKSPTMMQHISSVINDETKRLRFQVEKVLQMSMFDRSKATFRIQEVDANSAINSITNTFKLKVERYGGQITTELDATNAIISVDEMHFTNVIFNLLDNAVKYRREDVPLHLTVSTENLPNERLQVTVSDNGIGIRKEDLKKIFDKFYRVSTGNRHDVKGFGLGLAYVQKMVTIMGGTIKVESDPDQGTKFIITLPLTK